MVDLVTGVEVGGEDGGGAFWAVQRCLHESVSGVGQRTERWLKRCQQPVDGDCETAHYVTGVLLAITAPLCRLMTRLFPGYIQSLHDGNVFDTPWPIKHFSG